MSDDKTKIFENVTPAIFVCVKTKGEHHVPPAQYNPSNSNKGTVTIKTFVGKIELGFTYDPDKKTLTYVIIDKPGVVPISSLWGGFEKTVESCRSSFAE